MKFHLILVNLVNFVDILQENFYNLDTKMSIKIEKNIKLKFSFLKYIQSHLSFVLDKKF